MTAVLLDGNATARTIKDELRAEVEGLRARGVVPGLGVVLAGENPASAVYVRNKTRACDELGIYHETALFPPTTTTEEVAAKVSEYGRREDIHGILVQLPLPTQVDASRVLSLVDPAKDVPFATGWVRAASRKFWRVMPVSDDIARAARSLGMRA